MENAILKASQFCGIAEIILWSFTFTAAKARWSLVWQILEVHKLRNRRWKQGFCSQHQMNATMTMHPATKQLPKWPSWQGEDPESVPSSSFGEVFARFSQNLAAKKSNLQAFKLYRITHDSPTKPNFEFSRRLLHVIFPAFSFVQQGFTLAEMG